jgi:hypothetical protein
MDKYGPLVVSVASLAVACLTVYFDRESKRKEEHVRALLSMTEQCLTMSDVLADVNKMLLDEDTFLIIPVYSDEPIVSYHANVTKDLPNGDSIIRVSHHDVIFALSSNEKNEEFPKFNAWAELVGRDNMHNKAHEFGAYTLRFMTVLSLLSVQEQLFRENELSIDSVPMIIRKFIDMIAGEGVYKGCMEPHLLAAVHDYVVYRQHFANDVQSLIRRFYPLWTPTTMTDDHVKRTLREFRERHANQRLQTRQ